MKLVSINVGKPTKQTYGEVELVTSIYKQSISNERIYLHRLNLTGDEQADLKHHGGPDKAICVYSHNHYPYWEQKLDIELPLGAFGENLTVEDCHEDTVFLGDIFALGETILQVSQPRQPCFKLARRYQVEILPQLVIETGYTGFYMRVLQEGYVSIHDSITLVKRHPQGISISRCNEVLYKNNHIDKVESVLAVKEIADSLRKSLLKRKM
jgi:MOSC domain-containing protein YiiM